MSGYNFHDIFEALEFQDFARDMIQVRDNLRFESFGEGKDGGMDARCLGGNSESPIYRTHRRFCYLRVSYPAIFRTCERFSRQF